MSRGTRLNAARVDKLRTVGLDYSTDGERQARHRLRTDRLALQISYRPATLLPSRPSNVTTQMNIDCYMLFEKH